jgi:hypothetical protein
MFLELMLTSSQCSVVLSCVCNVALNHCGDQQILFCQLLCFISQTCAALLGPLELLNKITISNDNVWWELMKYYISPRVKQELVPDLSPKKLGVIITFSFNHV